MTSKYDEYKAVLERWKPEGKVVSLNANKGKVFIEVAAFFSDVELPHDCLKVLHDIEGNAH